MEGKNKPNRPIVVLGAGGHAKVVIEIIRAMGSYDIIGCLSSDASSPPILGVPILGTDADMPTVLGNGVRDIAIAIGNNKGRLALAQQVLGLGFQTPALVHPASTVSPSASIGMGTVIMAGAVVNALSRIGSFAIINTLAGVDHDCLLGAGVHLAPRAALAGFVEVGEAAFMGIGSCAIPNSKIGAGAVIGAGGVVVTDIAPNVTAVGVPARPVPQSGA